LQPQLTRVSPHARGGFVELKDVSGVGGSKTFKVKAEKAAESLPITVVLHRADEKDNMEHFFMRRMAAASQVLSDAGIGPRRLEMGGDWYLEEWDARCKGSPMPRTLEDWANIGRLTARLHRVPTEWFIPFRGELIQQHPHMNGVPKGSHVWMWLSRWGAMQGCLMEDHALFLDYADPGPFAPRHPAAYRIVTVHGDMHLGNMIDLGDAGLGVIDLEFVCVTSAAFDLGRALLSTESTAERSAFLSAYLEASGFLVTDTDIHELLLDCRFALMTYGLGVMPRVEDLWDESASEVRAIVQYWKGWAAEVWVSTERQCELQEEGLPELWTPTFGLFD